MLFASGTPSSNCNGPASWPPGTLIDGVNMNGQIENQAFIYSTINTVSSAGAITAASPNKPTWVCYTPLGRTYYSTGAATPTFSPLLGVLQIDVNRAAGGAAIGITRTIIVPPSGAARIYSH
jgi:hypothetical protein